MSPRCGDAALAAAAVLFGSTFLVVQEAVEDVDPLSFLAVRFAVAGTALVPFIRGVRWSRRLLRDGTLAGLALTAGYVLQTVGLQHTTSSVSAFLTYLLVVIVPLLSTVVLRRPPLPSTLVGIVLAVAGLVLLTDTGVGVGRGEVLTLLCAVAFAVHILVLAEVAARHDVVALNLVQFGVVVAVLAGPALSGGAPAGFGVGTWAAALYTGVAVSAVAFGLQVWGQRRVTASRAALVLMLEPVVAAVLGRLAGERLGAGGVAGASLILAGIVASELGGPLLDRRPARDQPAPPC